MGKGCSRTSALELVMDNSEPCGNLFLLCDRVQTYYRLIFPLKSHFHTLFLTPECPQMWMHIAAFWLRKISYS